LQAGSPGPAGDQYVGLDQFGRIVEQQYSDGFDVDLTYGYDADGNVLYEDNLNDSSESQLFHASGAPSDGSGYDALNRLTSYEQGTLSTSSGGSMPDTVSSPVTSQSWSLDDLGNWDSQTVGSTTTPRIPNTRNQVTQIGTGDDATNLSYDSNGNVLDDGTNTYTYDAWNRMATFTTDDGAGTTNTDMYDALGRRIVEDWTPDHLTDSHGRYIGFGHPDYTALYYSSADQVLEEDTIDEGITSITTNVWGQQNVNDLVEKEVTPTGGSTTEYYAEHDANFNVVALTDNSDDVLERYQYDPYGNVTFLNPDFSSEDDGNVSSYGMQYLFQGMRYDPNSGLYHADARDYSPALGTWTEEDPASSNGGLNAYIALDDNPLFYSDPWGEFPIKLVYSAFIPKSLGQSVTVPGAPANVNWISIPSPADAGFGLSDARIAATDDRNTANQFGTSRLYTIAQFNSTSIGALTKAQVSSYAGNSWQAARPGNPPGGLGINPQMARSDFNQRSFVNNDVEDANHTSSVITADVSGSFPFAYIVHPVLNFAPDIRYSITWIIMQNCGHVSVTGYGERSNYPAHSVLVNNQVVYKWYPQPGELPGYGNLFWNHTSFSLPDTQLS
jgi:RHS repeat-associated protein